MKYNLVHRDGNFHDGHWSIEWDLEVEGECIHHADGVKIKIVQGYRDNVRIHLDAIPERIDVTNDGTIWIMDEADVIRSPKPYHTLDSQTAISVWIKGEREVVTQEEIGEPIFA